MNTQKRIHKFASTLNYDPAEVLQEPFLSAFLKGHVITFKAYHGEDHEYVSDNLGIHPVGGSDCSYHADGMDGFSFSSYGDNGAVFCNDLTEDGKRIFLDMVAQSIITPYGVYFYKQEEDGICTLFDYKDGRWRRKDRELHKFVPCSNPYEAERQQ